MLSRTADHLFWMSRYTERAENTARLLDVNYQTSLLSPTSADAQAGWRALLGINELSPAYAARHGDSIHASGVMDFMVRDESNPSSLICCLRNARENARAVRAALTTELWETHNQTWLEARRLLQEGEFEREPGAFFEWVKFRSHLSRGVSTGTMLQDEAFHFLRLGTFLERADNTARLVDVKFHAVPGAFPLALPGAAGHEGIHGAPAVHDAPKDHDFYHWSAILRSVSAFEVYRKVYRDVVRLERVAELLMLRADMPRSLLACLNEVIATLALVGGDPLSETQRHAKKLRASLEYARIDEIVAAGLHTFLTQFLAHINALGAHISREFLLPSNA